jgi:phosphoribosylamine--glycine ligase
LSGLHGAPGNPGIAALAHCHPVRADDAEGLIGLAQTVGADLVVVGPEAPLVAGLGDELRRSGFAVFGPSAAAARIEGSKAFCKEILAAAAIPTAARLDVARAPCVIKADGLAAGKGVFVCHTEAEVEAGLRAAAALGEAVVIEELLEGQEVSLFALSDGRDLVSLGAAQDFKRIGDGDVGPNTGGMGAYAPVPWLEDVSALVEEVNRPVVDELARRGTPFVGCLFAGVMLTADGPRVLEFNARFGDPETQALLPLVEGDFLEVLAGAAHGELAGARLGLSNQAAVNVVVAAPDYPERSDNSGSEITGIEAAEAAGALVFHGGTAIKEGRLVTHGGRILSVAATGPTVADARARAYEAVSRVSFSGAKYRRDIAEVASG